MAILNKKIDFKGRRQETLAEVRNINQEIMTISESVVTSAQKIAKHVEEYTLVTKLKTALANGKHNMASQRGTKRKHAYPGKGDQSFL